MRTVPRKKWRTVRKVETMATEKAVEMEIMATEKDIDMETGMTKKILRKAILSARDALTEVQQKRAEILITERILGHQWYYRSDILLAFVSYGSEISTLQILGESLKKGKKVFVPRVEGEDMVFYRITALADLKEGYKGILEPDGTTESYIYSEEEAQHTLLLMPGVAFDLMRNRMGYGKGFYDRFLKEKEGLWIRSIAIGHACQMTEQVPCEEHDIRPYQIICV